MSSKERGGGPEGARALHGLGIDVRIALGAMLLGVMAAGCALEPAESPGGDPQSLSTCTPACGTGERCSGANECSCGEVRGAPGAGPVCGAGEVCESGVCRTPGSFCGSAVDCGAGEDCCDGECVDSSSDPAHCGGCGVACAMPNAEGACVAGSCQLVECAQSLWGRPLYYDCAGDGPGCGTPKSTSDCGGCGIACGAGEQCSGAGECTCGGTQSGPGAGPACAVGETCDAGVCTPTAGISVLIYQDRYSSGYPGRQATDALGWADVSVFYQDGPGFQTAYLSRSWDLVVVSSTANLIPSEVISVAIDRANASLPLLFGYWDLDGSSTDTTALRAALEVSVVDYTDPHPIYPATGASVDFFLYVETLPVPLVPSQDSIDNGDFLTPTGSGEVLISSDPSGNAVGVLTNSRTSLVLGFLISDYRGVDNDSDGRNEDVELYMNFFQWFADGRP